MKNKTKKKVKNKLSSKIDINFSLYFLDFLKNNIKIYTHISTCTKSLKLANFLNIKHLLYYICSFLLNIYLIFLRNLS